MRGVLLAGGTGSRLNPLTKVTNKHLLPVYDKPMIYYPINTLSQLMVTKLLIITGGEYIGSIADLLGDGNKFNMEFTYKIQENPDGIAGALSLAEDFVNNKSFYTILGDNIFLDDTIDKNVFSNEATIYVQKVKDAYRFGTYIPKDNIIIEKPNGVTDGLCVTGLYKYPSDVFEYIKRLTPSTRGELEITDVNNWYLKQNRMEVLNVKEWFDAGTFDSLLKSSIAAQNKCNNSRWIRKWDNQNV